MLPVISCFNEVRSAKGVGNFGVPAPPSDVAGNPTSESGVFLQRQMGELKTSEIVQIVYGKCMGYIIGASFLDQRARM